MPIYEYRCKNCNREFEYQQRMSDDPKSVCEECGGQLERLISRSSFHLKGSGWYKDLYSSPQPKSDTKSAEAGTESASGDAASSSAGGDKSGGDKSGSDKSGGDKSGGDKSGGEKKSAQSKSAAGGSQ